MSRKNAGHHGEKRFLPPAAVWRGVLSHFVVHANYCPPWKAHSPWHAAPAAESDKPQDAGVTPWSWLPALLTPDANGETWAGCSRLVWRGFGKEQRQVALRLVSPWSVMGSDCVQCEGSVRLTAKLTVNIRPYSRLRAHRWQRAGLPHS